MTTYINFVKLRITMRWGIALFCLLFAVTPLSGKPADAEEKDPLANKSAMEIVIIASEGMAESLDKSTKLDAVRQALSKSLKFVAKDTHVALRVSGHRVAKSDAEQSCADSELMIRPDAGTIDAVAAKLGDIRPQGKHSVVKSLSLALADLAKYGGTKTLMLFTDGKDDCLDQDPIAFLAPASLKNQNYVIHIRGVGLSEDAAASLKAIADGTGGTFTTANDSSTLAQQMGISPAKEAPPPKPAQPGQPETPIAPKPGQPEAPIAKAPPPPPPPPPTLDTKKLVREIVKEVNAAIAKMPKPKEPKPLPLPPPKTFSKVSLLIIGIETLLLILSFAVIILLAIKKR